MQKKSTTLLLIHSSELMPFAHHCPLREQEQHTISLETCRGNCRTYMQIRDVCLSSRYISAFILPSIEFDVRALVLVLHALISVVHALHMGHAMPSD